MCSNPGFAQNTSNPHTSNSRHDAFFGAAQSVEESTAAAIANGPPRSLQLTPLIPYDLKSRLRASTVAQDNAESAELAPRDGDAALLQPSLLPEDVMIAELSDWDVASSGLMGEGQGGLPADLWGVTTMDQALAALDGLPVTAPSPVMQSLIERLLLSVANPPLQAEGRGWEFVQKRLQLIEARGDILALAQMLDVLPVVQGPTQLAAQRTDAFFLSGDIAGACLNVKTVENASDTPYWLEAGIACRALQGDQAGARLALDALKEQRRPDPFYEALLRQFLTPTLVSSSGSTDVAASVPVFWPVGQPVSPLLLALAEVAGVALPDASPEMAGVILEALALSPAMAPDRRVQSAEIMANHAVFPPDKLAAIALSVPVQFESAASLNLEPDLAGRIGSFQVAVQTYDPALKLAALRDLWRAADEDGVYTAWALATAETAALIEPAPELIDGSVEIARALALSNDQDRVIAWYRLARANAVRDPVFEDEGLGNTDILLQIWPLALVLDQWEQVPFSGRILELWWQAQSERTATEQAERAVLFFSLLDALGRDVPAEVWTLLADFGAELSLPVAGGADWESMLGAVHSHALGPTIAYTLKSIGQDGPAGADVTILQEAIRGLRTIGLEKEAQQLAVEALIAKGF